jgi:hypothetical protein
VPRDSIGARRRIDCIAPASFTRALNHTLRTRGKNGLGEVWLQDFPTPVAMPQSEIPCPSFHFGFHDGRPPSNGTSRFKTSFKLLPSVFIT